MVEKGYVIAVGKGVDMQEAQQQSVTLVKQSIVRSVAENVVSKSTLLKTEQNNEINSAFSQSIISKANKVPYVQGISVNKADEFYWEKIKDKKAGTFYFNYYIKYPFSDGELGKLVAEYKREDQKLTDRLNTLEAEVDMVSSVEQIKNAIDELQSLKEELEDRRGDKAALLIIRYRNLYSEISIHDNGSALGSINYSLMLSGRKIATAARPNIKSNCATIVNQSLGKEDNIITYTYEGCYEDQENTLSVQYRLGNVTLMKQFYISLSEGKLTLKVKSPIGISIYPDGVKASIPVDAAYATPFSIAKIDFAFSSSPMYTSEGINMRASKGTHSIAVEVKADDVKRYVKKTGLVDGTIWGVNEVTGESFAIKFSKIRYTSK